MKFKIYPVDAKHIIEVVKIAHKCKEIGKKFDKNVVIQAFNKSKTTALNAIGAAEQLNLFNIDEKIVQSSKEDQIALFREKLQNYRPFMDFLEFLYDGHTPEESVQIVKSIYGFKRKTEDILWTFSNWGKFAKIFKDKKGVLEFLDEIKKPVPSKIVELKDVLNDQLKARIWVKKILGNAVKLLSDKEFDSLVSSMLLFEENPRESIKLAGEVLEDFLRTVAKTCNVDVSKKNGIEEIAVELRRHKIIASKHTGILRGLQVFLDRKIFSSLSAFRNMAHHGKDKYEDRRWELSSELALSYVIQVILCIKSLYSYVIEKQLKF